MKVWDLFDTEVQVIHGDITEMKVDAIVNAANNRLWMGGGVAGAIKRKGGQTIEDEAVKLGPIPTGEAVVTTAGSLPAKHVIHAACMGQDLKTNLDKVRRATRSALARAEEREVRSMAFPAIGTGVGRLDPGEVAMVMVDSVIEHIQAGTCLERVLFVLYTEDVHAAFLNEMVQRLGGPGREG